MTLGRVGGAGAGAAGGGPGGAARAMGAAVAANGEVLGTERAPIYMQQLEPTFRAQAWRTVGAGGASYDHKFDP